MQKKHPFYTQLTFVAALCFFSSLALANWVVIANKNLISNQLSKKTLVQLYKGQTKKWNGQVIKPVNQLSGTKLFKQFYHDTTGWSQPQVISYWSERVLSGKASPPISITASSIMATVAKTPGAIAYVNTNSLKNSPLKKQLKVIYRYAVHTSKASAAAIDLSGHQRNLLLPKPHSTHGGIDMNHPNTSFSFHQDHLKVKNPNHKPQSISTKTDHYQVPLADPGNNIWLSIVKHFKLQADYQQPLVKKQKAWFLAHPKMLTIYLRNSIPYLAYIYQQTQSHHMPAEFALLPMLESGYNPYAYSRVGAAGLWQMMPQTATLYGLNISWWYDARRDILLSTKAALDYLKTLHHQFKNWELVAASYNAGEGLVDRSIRYNHLRDRPTGFWNLRLPTETQQYVPKLLALADIIEHAKQYHIQLPDLTKRLFFNTVVLQSQMNLKTLSSLTGVSINLIHYLNPGLRRYATKPHGRYTLLIPMVMTHYFKNHYQHLVGKKYDSWQYHEVYRGETLHKIAHNYRTSISLLSEINSLPGDTVIAGQGILVPVPLDKRYQPIVKIGVADQEAKIGHSLANKHNEVISTSNAVNLSSNNTQSPIQSGASKEPKHQNTLSHVDTKQVALHSTSSAQAVQELISTIFYNINLLH